MTLELPAQLAAEAHGRKADGGGEKVAWKGQNREIHDTAADDTGVEKRRLTQDTVEKETA